MSTHAHDSQSPPVLARRRDHSYRISSPRTCRFCEAEFEIEPAEPVAGSGGQLGHAVEEAVAMQMEEDGWKRGACPLCAFAREEELRAEHHADNETEVAP